MSYFIEESKCPNCHQALEKTPKRKTNCPLCKRLIFPRTRVSDKVRLLISEEELPEFEKENDAIYFERKWIRTLSGEGFDEKEFEIRKLKKEIQLGFKPKIQDVVWAILQELTQKAALVNDFRGMQVAYHHQKHFLIDEGKDPRSAIIEQMKWRLRTIAESKDFQSFELITCNGNSCDHCNEFNNLKFTFDEAISAIPKIVMGCTSERY